MAWNANRSQFTNRQRAQRHRTLRLEPLEARTVLAANPLAFGAMDLSGGPDTAPAVEQSIIDTSLAARDQALAISAIHLRVGGEEITLKSLDDLVKIDIGDKLEVVGIDYRLNSGEGVSGKIAFEGYLNSLKDSKLVTDYSDGRFGRHEQQGQLPEGETSHGELEGGWEMQAGTESLTLVMVRYDANGHTVEDRVNIRTQVGTPDFAISPRVVVRGSGSELTVGKQTKIYGTWANLGEGTFRNYAEVDIYHESDPTKIVWAGTLSKTLGAKQAVIGEFRNANSDEQFSKRWTPELAGTYTIKMYADPEQNWEESNESNNVTVMTVTVDAGKGKIKDALKHRAIAEQPEAPALNLEGFDATGEAQVVKAGQAFGDVANATTPASTAEQVATDFDLQSTQITDNRLQGEESSPSGEDLRGNDSDQGWTAMDLAFAGLV